MPTPSRNTSAPTSGLSRPRLDTTKFGPLVTLGLCGLLAGLVLAVSAFPVVALTGLSAKAASDSFQNLPDTLQEAPIPQTSMLYTSNGSYITSFYDENRVYVSLKDVPKVMQNAMIAAEDKRFYQHHGVDAQGVLRALVVNKQAGEVQQGASTLTQQLVKNTLLYSAKTEEERKAATASTTARKLREIRYAIALEKKLTKEQILERYLNIAFFGNRAHGVYAAAQGYFSKEPKDLTVAESALIAGLVQSPSLYDPTREDNTKAKERRNYVLDRMVSDDYVSRAEADAAKAEEIKLNPKSMPRKCENAQAAEYGFYCGWFLEWWKQNKQFGNTRQERESQLERGGYRITLAVDPDMQSAAQRAIDRQISRNNQFAIGEVVVEPGTGRVKAMAINRTYSIGDNQGGKNFPNTTNPLLSGTNVSAGYQAGSTFKMFTMVAALDQGMPLSIRIKSPHKYVSKYFTGPGGSSSCPRGNGSYRYCPSNASPGMTGNHTMWSGFGESVNTFFIQLEERVGVKAAIEMAEKMGVVFRSDADIKNKANPDGWGSFTLGTAQVTPLDMATSYATLAARGKHCEPTPLLKVTDTEGKELPFAEPKCNQAVPEEVADAANDAAKCPLGGKAAGSCVNSSNGVTAGDVSGAIKRQVAGKTGTTNDNNASWFVGYTPNLASAVFKANPDSPNTSVPGTSDPKQVFKSTMVEALKKLPNEKFTAPKSNRAQGTMAVVPRVVGSDPQSAKATIERAGFKAEIAEEQVPSNERSGRVARTDPDGGERVVKGSTVIIHVSNGERPVAATPDQNGPANGQPGNVPQIPGMPGQNPRGRNGNDGDDGD